MANEVRGTLRAERGRADCACRLNKNRGAVTVGTERYADMLLCSVRGMHTVQLCDDRRGGD